MGCNDAANEIQQYLNNPKKKAPKPDADTDDWTKKAVDLYRVLVTNVLPAMIKFKKFKSEDPFMILPKMLKMVKQKKIDFGSYGEIIIRWSSTGRHSAVHFRRNKVENDYEKYMDAYIELCIKMGDTDAATAIIERKLVWIQHHDSKYLIICVYVMLCTRVK